ncbi:ribonuclease HII [Bacteroidetes/Chlorobi group bacterium ChocPot_Mid]|jgi:ribonuclease HII|nr:MAG: ribonuclease HII [Bacteroidetes/Chlorobi group bacterium ChocPot_Mid]
MKTKKTNTLEFDIEKPFIEKGMFVAGIDEAGRGPLAGPVVAAAVILKPEFHNTFGITDSKKINQSQREKLFNIIIENSLSVGIGIIDNNIIDEINILQATLSAMQNAITQLNPQPQQLLIDGNYFKNIGIPYQTIIKGDGKCLSIAAASIIAKVTRDRWMNDVADKLYPQYNFKQHKGYGTKSHIEAIQEFGICEIHRKTFLKRFIDTDIEIL